MRSLGLNERQVLFLRYKLPFIRALANPASYASRTETIALLEDLAKLCADLDRRLAALVTQPTAAHGLVHALIEERYWQGERNLDEGPTSSHHLILRLRELEAAALDAREAIPSEQSRPRTADPRPIEQIADALSDGWRQEQEERTRSEPTDLNSGDDLLDGVRRPLPPLPRKWLPSSGAKSAFREIAGICYRTVGGTDDPLAAIRAFMEKERAKRKESEDDFKAWWASQYGEEK